MFSPPPVFCYSVSAPQFLLAAEALVVRRGTIAVIPHSQSSVLLVHTYWPRLHAHPCPFIDDPVFKTNCSVYDSVVVLSCHVGKLS